MKTSPKTKLSAAAILTSLLFTAATTSSFAQTTSSVTAPDGTPKASVDASTDETVQMDAYTVTTGTRAPKAINQIPGAITVIGQDEISAQMLLNNDPAAVLQETVPGYGPSAQSLQSAGETLRGRVALRLFDGIPMSTPLREGSRSSYFSDMSVIGRIEVINGPSASEGIGAAGGIINFLSKTALVPGDITTLTGKYSKSSQSGSGDWNTSLNYTHKDGNFDALIVAGFEDNGLTYDAHGRAIGFHTSGSTADAKTNDIFAKFGRDFGNMNDQRIQVSISRYELRGKGTYSLVLGDRTIGLTNTVARLKDPLPVYNDMYSYTASYTNKAFFGGTLTLQGYRSSEAEGFVSAIDPSKQDPLIAPVGTLVDQSEINSQKKGIRSNWTGQDLFKLTGLELSVGIDVVQDTTQQLLAVANRTWVPPLKYTSFAPYAQLDYKIGPVTLSGGVRHEDGKLDVKTFTTIYTANRTLVTGGDLKYNKNIPNAGVVVALPYGFSAFGSLSKGFGLPDVGIALRGISTPGQSIASLFGQLQAVITDATEVGGTWKGKAGSFGASYYRTKSQFGSSLIVDPVTQDYILRRLPVNVQGYEMNAEVNLYKGLVATALFSHATGQTATATGGPVNTPLGLLTISPDKFVSSLTYKWNHVGSVRIGTTSWISRTLIATNGYEDFQGYTLVDVGVTYKTKWGTFGLGISNALNKFYILPNSQFVGFENYWSGEGRVFSLSDSYRF